MDEFYRTEGIHETYYLVKFNPHRSVNGIRIQAVMIEATNGGLVVRYIPHYEKMPEMHLGVPIERSEVRVPVSEMVEVLAACE